MTRFRLSDRADNDLRDIYLYGVDHFGAAQAERYKLSMDDCFERLARHPKMGRLATTIGEGVRRHEHGSHVILYEEGTDHIMLLAVLHRRRLIDLKS